MVFEGRVKRVIFANLETGYIVFSLEDENGDNIVVKGEFFGLEEGDSVRVEGEFAEHPVYGRQFEASCIVKVFPKSKEGIIKYLSSGRIPGVGRARAEKIVELLGENCLDLIASDPDALLRVKGIGKARAEQIADKIKSEMEFARFSSILGAFGISPNLAFKIYKRFGIGAVEMIRADPYVLTDISGIGFKKADKIAANFGIDKGFPSRIRSGIEYILGEALNSGSTYLLLEELLDEACNMLEIERIQVESGIKDGVEMGRLVVDGEKVYLSSMYEEERRAAELVLRLFRSEGMMIDVSGDEIDEIGFELGLEFTEEQKEAIRGALANKVSIITGGPGTGKTTILRGLLRILAKHDIRVDLGAPTGRAARRITELTGYPAMTIHRLLEYNPQLKMFRRNEFFPLDGDFIIVDEMSMVDISLFVSLLRAIYKNASLLMIGDADQLPSVGPGRVLLDLIESGLFPVFRLTKIHRQAQKSLIIVNAHRVKNGLEPIIRNVRDSDFFFFKEEDPKRAADLIIDLVSRRLPSKMGFDPFSDIQVLTPMYKGETGADVLNARLQSVLNPASVGLRYGRFEFRIGDRVMQTKNNYDKGVFNGELGIIKDISDDGSIFVLFEHIVPYKGEELEELSLAYAATVHKSQGNEYPVVIVPLLFEHYIMLARNLLYTALTRAKKLAIVVGSLKALYRAVRNEKMITRYSGLIDRLKGQK